MTHNELKDILSRGESEHVEMTRAFNKADKMGQAICAFANDLSGSGAVGYLVLGVEDNGKISGRRVDDELFSSIGGIKTDGNLLPPPSMSIEKVEMSEGDVVVVSVFPSQYPPIRYNGQVWVRVGPRKCIATEEDIRILTERRARFGVRDEERPCKSARLEDLDLDLFRGLYLPKAINAQVIDDDDRPVLEQLSALRFYDLEAKCPTNAGVLLFAKHPERFIPSGYLQYVKFAGESNASEVLQENVFRGPLVKMVQDLDVFVKTGPGSGRPIPVSALREEMVAQYPFWALRELLLNAIIHRDYFFGNAPIKFYEYGNGRIEISNPGGLFGRATPQNFPFANDYRNPLIAEALKALGFVNKYNRGISKVREELHANGNPMPIFDINKLTEFRVTVLAAESGTTKSESGTIKSESGTIKSESGTINTKAYDIKSQEESVFEVVRTNPGVKKEKIFLKVQTSMRSIQRTLERLKAAGRIEYRGAKRNGGWFVRT